jgi:hypothetical protein
VFAPRERLMLADPGSKAERIQQAVMPPTICAADTTGGSVSGDVWKSRFNRQEIGDAGTGHA